VLHLIYRLIVQPNVSRANMFAQSFISNSGVEALLVLLQREAKAGNKNILDDSGAASSENDVPRDVSSDNKAASVDEIESVGYHETTIHKEVSENEATDTNDASGEMRDPNIEKKVLSSGNGLLKNLSGITFSITSDNVRNNVYNVDKGDGIVVGIIHIVGALVVSGNLKFDSGAASPNIPGGQTTLNEEGNTVSEDRVPLLLFALQKAFQAAPSRLMTANVYMALISAVVCVYNECNIFIFLFDSSAWIDVINRILLSPDYNTAINLFLK
jgi:hypothetical protein